jgi:phosphohistidine phosphatase
VNAANAGGPGDSDPSRRLILLRHAKSDWPDIADHERPLAKRGRRDAPAMGRWLGRSGYLPDAVVCSTAVRARQTWELVAEGIAAAVPAAAVPTARYEPRVYEATVLGLLMLVRELSDEYRTVLIVGHNPGMAELTVGLADPPPEPPAAFPTAAVAVLGLRSSWAQAGPGEAKLLAFAVPGDLLTRRYRRVASTSRSTASCTEGIWETSSCSLRAAARALSSARSRRTPSATAAGVKSSGMMYRPAPAPKSIIALVT